MPQVSSQTTGNYLYRGNDPTAPFAHDIIGGTSTRSYDGETPYANRDFGLMYRASRLQSNPRDVGNTSSARQPLVHHQYHNIPGTTQGYGAVNTSRPVPSRGFGQPWNSDLTLSGHAIPPMIQDRGTSQRVNTAAQDPQAHNNSGTNNYRYGPHCWECGNPFNVNVQGSQPRNISDNRMGNLFAPQNEYVNESYQPSDYMRGLTSVLSGTPSVAPSQDRNWSSSSFQPYDIRRTPHGTQSGAQYEYASEDIRPSQLLGDPSNAAVPLHEGARASRSGRRRNVSLRGHSGSSNVHPNRNTGNVLPSGGAGHVASRGESVIHNQLTESNLRNPLPPVQPVVHNQHFNFDGQISRPVQDYPSELQAGQWPDFLPVEQEHYPLQRKRQASDDETDAPEDSEEDEGEEAPPKKKSRKTTRGPLVNAKHAALEVPDCDLTASDIFCLFPKYYLRPALMKRLVNNGWQAKDIADAMSYHRGIHVKHQMIYNGSMKAVRKQMQRDKEVATPDANMRIASTDLPARTHEEIPNHGTSLYDLAARVSYWPRGRFLTPVMEAVKWCLDNMQIQYTLADLPALILQRGYQIPAPTNGRNLDQEYRDWIKLHFAKGHEQCDECRRH